MGGDGTYEALAAHLDSLPGGFPPSETGAHLSLLRCLFTPAEAALAVHLTLDREEPAAIAPRAGLTGTEAAALLAGMASKGLIFSAVSPEGRMLYQAVPFVVGIWEFQVDRLTPALLDAVNAYWGSMKRTRPVRTLTQMRTIPIGASIRTELEALPYEQVELLVDSQESIAVARCICRMEAELEGAGCGRIGEACLSFGDWADYFVREGKGRRITREEARAILAEASREGLVLQPSNSRSAAFICCCCSCCCGVLKRLKLHPRPAEIVVSRFIASFDPAACVSCSACAERCPMEAVTTGPDGAACFDPVRCIGCGLCVATCPAGAFRLERKPETPRHRVPETLSAVWREIVADQAAARPGS